MLGSCDFNNTNALTGAKSMTSVYADVNFDGTYDEFSNTPAGTDSVKGKNLFCLVSPLSFSCGNAVPAILKASGAVTIIGVTSGGGTSVVHPTSAADGTVFRISSKYVMSVSINGSNYDIDKGVEPHYYINQPANFYDKAKLQSLVNNINELNLTSN